MEHAPQVPVRGVQQPHGRLAFSCIMVLHYNAAYGTRSHPLGIMNMLIMNIISLDATHTVDTFPQCLP
jgi:hypothetical protein